MYRGTVIKSVVPLMCCRMEDPKYFPNEMSQVEFLDIGKCIKHGNKQFINMETCYDAVSIHTTISVKRQRSMS